MEYFVMDIDLKFWEEITNSEYNAHYFVLFE